MKISRISTFILILLLLGFGINLYGQYDCSSPTIISTLPYSATGLTTSTGASFEASGVCSNNYQEKDYIFKYTPSDFENISITLDVESNSELAGIYVFSGCSQPPNQCLGFEESIDGQLDINLIVECGQDYYIFIGTESTENFDISITKEEVQGVAINKAEPTQTLDVNGAIRISDNNSTPYAGTIRYNEDNNEFEGYNGTEWVLLSQKREFGQSVKVGLGAAADNGLAFNNFGRSVSISGDYAIVGSPYHLVGQNANQGKAYVFKRSNNSWLQEDEIIASDGAANDYFGRSVAISGDYIVVGSYFHKTNNNEKQGKAYIFHRNGNSWEQQDILIGSNGDANDQFGTSVDIFGDLVIVGSPLHNTNSIDDQGKAYVFKRSGTSWSQEAALIASDGAIGDQFGISVAISESLAIVGSYLHNTNSIDDQGTAYVFKRSGSSWINEEKLIASDGAMDDFFGISVAISGDYIVVGSIGNDALGNTDQGKAYVFRRSDTFWLQEAELNAEDGAASDGFGVSVGISGNYAIVGSYLHNTNGNSGQGKAYVFRRSGSTWINEGKLIANDGQIGSQFGQSVSISGSSAIVGSPFHDVGGNQNQGKVYFY